MPMMELKIKVDAHNTFPGGFYALSFSEIAH